MTRVSANLPAMPVFAARMPAAAWSPAASDQISFSGVKFGMAANTKSILPQSDNGLVREAVATLLTLIERPETRRELQGTLPGGNLSAIRKILRDPDIAKPVNIPALEKALGELNKALKATKSKAHEVKKTRAITQALQDALETKKALLIPGLTAPKSSLNDVNTYVEQNLGFKAATIKLFPIAMGLGLKNLAPLLGDYVDDYRILASRANMRLMNVLRDDAAWGPDETRDMLGLEDSETGRAIAVAAMDVYERLGMRLDDLNTPMVNTGPENLGEAAEQMKRAIKGNASTGNILTDVASHAFGLVKTHFNNLQGLTMHQVSKLTGYEMPDLTGLLYVLTNRKKEDEKLSTLVSAARRDLAREIENILQAEGDVPDVRRADVSKKLANHCIDLIFNRMVLLGHSMGGTAVLKTTQQGEHETYGHGDLDVGLSFCLGSPVNGVPIPPENLQGLHDLLTAISPQFREMVVGAARMVPAVRDMEAGSEAVEKMQERPTPYDATTFSITNPDDGLVPEEGAKLRTESGDPENPDKYVNQHNFTVTPKDSKISNLVPAPFRAVLALRKMNPLSGNDPMTHGLAQHCTVVQHAEQHFAVDGEVMQQLIAEARQPHRLRRLLHERNYEPLREHVLDLITDRVKQDKRIRRHYQQPALRAIFEEIAATPLPLTDGIDKKAARLLLLLNS